MERGLLVNLRLALVVNFYYRFATIGTAVRANTMGKVVLTTIFTDDDLLERNHVMGAAAVATALRDLTLG